jgi:hypothetical protein
MKLYINGKLSSTQYESNKSGTNTSITTIGGRWYGGLESQFSGFIDNLFLYYNVLSDSQICEQYAKYAPHLISAVASDGTIAQTGIDNDDYILFTFNKPVGSTTSISALNIDEILPLNNGHSWLSGFGTIGSATWNPSNTMLMVTLSTTVSSPTISIGDSVYFAPQRNKVAIRGSFGGPTAIESVNSSTSIAFDIYPTLFNPTTTIKFGRNIHSVLLSIYNVNGTKIESHNLKDTDTFIWSANNRASGIYFVNALIEGKVNQKKICLLK